MTVRESGAGPRLLVMLVAFVVGFGALFVVARGAGWLSPFGLQSESHDSQVVQAIERTQEVSLLSLGVQGLKDERRSSTIFGKNVPGTGETVYIEYRFQAKLGLDGSKVTVTKDGDQGLTISVPEFEFIGFEEPTFRVAATDGGPLTWFTPDIDRLELANEVLGDAAKQDYLTSSQDLLRAQTEVFYGGLVKAIDPDLVVSFDYP